MAFGGAARSRRPHGRVRMRGRSVRTPSARLHRCRRSLRLCGRVAGSTPGELYDITLRALERPERRRTRRLLLARGARTPVRMIRAGTWMGLFLISCGGAAPPKAEAPDEPATVATT